MLAEWQQVRAAQADPAKFRPLYERYFETIFHFIYNRTLDESLSADLCSTVFLKALQQLHKYTFKGVPFSAWLYRIAANEVAQHYRRTTKRRVIALETHHLHQLIEPGAARDKEPIIQALIQAFEEMRPQDVELIEMRFFEERPFKEIADILGITESNAKMRTYRVLERMRKILERMGIRPADLGEEEMEF